MQNLKLYHGQKKLGYEAQPNLQTQQAWVLFDGKIKTTTLKTKLWHPEWLHTVPRVLLQQNWKNKESTWLLVLI